MTTRQRKTRAEVVGVTTVGDESFTGIPTMQEGLDEGINILPSIEGLDDRSIIFPPSMDARDVIMVGNWVVYRVRAGRVIPMLVTAVHGPELIDGVAFSARPSDVGNTYGSRGHQRVKQGAGDGEWQA